jgi:hypothetical protein
MGVTGEDAIGSTRTVKGAGVHLEWIRHVASGAIQTRFPLDVKRQLSILPI